MSNQKVGFIGLGVMGYPMAGHLAKNGYQVTVHNRTLTKSEKWAAEYNGRIAHSAAEAAENAELVFVCVGTSDDVRDVTLGTGGILSTLSEGSLLIDHTTASAELAKELANHARSKSIGFLDAPVSGGEIGAQNGKLSIMVGGDYNHFNRALPLMKSYGATINLMGVAGSGQLTKMVNQICIAGALEGVAEAMRFGVNAGLDMQKVLSVISKGAAQSWQLENRGPTMLENKFDFGFAVDLMRKDLSLCLEEAEINGSILPVASLVAEFYSELQRQGKGRYDFSSLFTLLEKKDE